MDDHVGQHDSPEPTQDDLSAAESVIARMDEPPAPDSPKYAALRHGIASMRTTMGPDRFALAYGLREPRDRMEELERALFQQGITPDEYAEEVKAHAERPIDADMLAAFCDGYEARVTAYADLLQTVVTIATDQRDAESWRRLEPQVDAAAARMDAKLKLFSDELGTILRFLTELRAAAGEPVRCGSYTGDSAHWIAALVLSHASQAWKGCKETAHRSRTDPAYLYATTASSLFFQTWIEPGKLPAPNDLAALMRLERAAAESELRDRAKPKPDAASWIKAAIVEIKADSVSVQPATAKAARGAASGDADWHDVQRRLLELNDRGVPYTSIGKLAKQLGCANATVQKAIKNSATLKGWQARHTGSSRSPRATSITEMVTDNAEQFREPDPTAAAEGDDVDLVFARLIQEAQPEERAQLNEMDADARRAIVELLKNDPDQYDRVLGRRP
ncbi:MAG: hypothetical protein JXO22_04905 [Phycisphaerae bacterium]|nr:hypothetical protein [Phycisphaerae bacterium]